MHSSAGSDHPDLESREGPWFESIPILGTGNASTKKNTDTSVFFAFKWYLDVEEMFSSVKLKS